MVKDGPMRRLAALVSLALVTTYASAGATEPLKAVTHGKPVILHIGDSFTATGFAQTLRPKIEGLGKMYKVAYKTSAYTTTLPKDVGLLDLVAQYQPTLTIITLGANEIPLADATLRKGAIKRIVEQASRYGTCVWTLPPTWRDDGNEILEVIRAEAAPCKVYDAGALAKDIPRKKDKIHPTPEGGAKWAEAFWKWLGENDPKAIEPVASEAK
jgi:lysophospholipase L1-like esterase